MNKMIPDMLIFIIQKINISGILLNVMEILNIILISF